MLALDMIHILWNVLPKSLILLSEFHVAHFLVFCLLISCIMYCLVLSREATNPYSIDHSLPSSGMWLDRMHNHTTYGTVDASMMIITWHSETRGNNITTSTTRFYVFILYFKWYIICCRLVCHFSVSSVTFVH
jgi:hypothetical protein